MDCPECGGSLAAYALRGREAAVCERCGWVGIEADHRGEAASAESWDDALHRFYDRHVETERRRADLPSVAASADPGPEATTVDGEGAESTRDGTEGGDGGSTRRAATDGTADDEGSAPTEVDEDEDGTENRGSERGRREA